jgi:hypothetical protein
MVYDGAMPHLDRALTYALIANFKALAAKGADRETVLTAILRLKGEALRLGNRIAERERIGGPLKMGLAKADRARLAQIRRILSEFEPNKG